MIAATVAMASMAALFIVFGMFALADGKGCDGTCGTTCTRECETELEGKLR